MVMWHGHNCHNIAPSCNATVPQWQLGFSSGFETLFTVNTFGDFSTISKLAQLSPLNKFSKLVLRLRFRLELWFH